MSQRQSSRAPARGGFMMIEMFVAMMLLTAFALVAGRLFTSSMRVTAEAPLAEQQILSFDSMLETLRSDVWSAGDVRSSDQAHVEIDGIRWSVTGDGAVVRSAGGETRKWPGVGERVRFERDEAGVVMRVLDRRGLTPQLIVLPSEVALLRRAAR